MLIAANHACRFDMQTECLRKLQEADTAFNAHTTAAERAVASKWEHTFERLQAMEHDIATNAMHPRCSISALLAARPAHIEGLVSSWSYLLLTTRISVGSSVNFAEMRRTFNNSANKQRLAYMLLLHDIWRSNGFAYVNKRGQSVMFT